MSNRKNISSKQTPELASETFIPAGLSGRVLAGIALIIVTVVLIYLPSISGEFIFDDTLVLTDNPLVLSSAGLYQFWSAIEQQVWPVSNASLWIEWRLWGINPTGYHVTNLLLHIIETLLIWLILRKLCIPGAFWAALIFAVHPVNVESVAWIAQRKGLLALLFILLSILCYLKFELPSSTAHCPPSTVHSPLHTAHRPLFYWLSLAAFVLAMFSKGSAAVLPPLLLGILWWRRELTKKNLLDLALFFVVALLLTGINVWFQTFSPEDPLRRNAGFLERLLGAGGVVWFYLYKAMLPLNLVFIYPQWRIEPSNPLWWLPLLAAVAVTIVLWRFKEGWSRPFLFAWGFFCVSLAPVLGIVDVGYMRYSLVADHYQHIALIGVIALAAAGCSVWRQRTWGRYRSAANTMLIAVLVVFMFLSWRQSRLYRAEIKLYQAALEKNPNSWLVHNNLAVALEKSGQLSEAIEQYEVALKLVPAYTAFQYVGVYVNNNLGDTLIKAGRLSEAIVHFQQALRLKPDSPQTHHNLGFALAKADRLTEALEHYRQALHFKPDYPEAHNNLGLTLDKLGRYPEAIEHFQQALRLKADFSEAHNNLGLTLVKSGRLSEAIEQYKAAIKLSPDYPEVHNNLGIALAKAGRPQEAVDHYQQALRLKPNYANAHNNLADILVKVGRYPQAVEHYQQALRLKPNYPEAHNSLGLALDNLNRYPEAIEQYQQALRLKPDYPEAHNNLGADLWNVGQQQEAIEHYQQALRLKPDYPDAHNNLGVALSNAGRTQEAIEHFQKALSLKSDSIETYMNLALTYAKLQQSNQALAAAQRALDLARSKKQTELSKQIEDWLNTYRQQNNVK